MLQLLRNLWLDLIELRQLGLALVVEADLVEIAAQAVRAATSIVSSNFAVAEDLIARKVTSKEKLGAIPLPSKWIVEFCEPIPTAHLGPDAASDPMRVLELTEQVRTAVGSAVSAGSGRASAVVSVGPACPTSPRVNPH